MPSRIRHRRVPEVCVPQSPSQPADARARQLGSFTCYRARGLAVRQFSFGAVRPHGCVTGEAWALPAPGIGAGAVSRACGFQTPIVCNWQRKQLLHNLPPDIPSSRKRRQPCCGPGRPGRQQDANRPARYRSLRVARLNQSQGQCDGK